MLAEGGRGAIALSTLVSPVTDTPVETVPSVLIVVLALFVSTIAGSLAFVAAVVDSELFTALESMLVTRYLIAYVVA